jgi:hypothetical protein
MLGSVLPARERPAARLSKANTQGRPAWQRSQASERTHLMARRPQS